MLDLQMEIRWRLQDILYSCPMIGRGRPGNLFKGKVRQRIRLITGRHRSTGNLTDKRKGYVSSRWIHVDPNERAHHHLETRLLVDFADDGEPWRFAPFEAASWEIPQISIAAVAE